MPLQMGLILYIVTIPPLILSPKTICSHTNGMPKTNDKSKNCTRKLAIKRFKKKYDEILQVCHLHAYLQSEPKKLQTVKY